MDISVMLEHTHDNGYRATAIMPTPLMVEAPTRDQAMDRIRTLLTERLASAELIRIQVPASGELNPWLAIAGTWRDHPDIDDVEENIRAYRREVDADPDRI
jgi:hypothetical protein